MSKALRLIRSSDRDQLAQWISTDHEHKDIFTADFWYEGGRVSFAVEDKFGVVMYVKLTPEPPAMRLYIQFCYESGRVAKAMLKHFPEVRAMVKATGAESIVFDTKNPKLASFCIRAFGFEPVKDCDYRLLL